jgi:hypothetical protein
MNQIENTFFDKNKYHLYGKNKIIYDISKEKCALNTIKNNYKGFIFEDKKNKCLTSNSQEIDDILIDNLNYNKNNVKTYFKTKNTIDFENITDQLDNLNYFTPILNDKYKLKGFIEEENVYNEKDCIDKCINDIKNKCNSIIYIKNPNVCTLYENIKMKNNKNNNDNNDIYTLKKNISKKNIDQYSFNNEIKEENNEIKEENNEIKE